ncbi:MAG: hypothetical protein N3B21_00890 [Clostridia bacterium]|nr:hypothetical protein [Clostridia bacterium]
MSTPKPANTPVKVTPPPTPAAYTTYANKPTDSGSNSSPVTTVLGVGVIGFIVYKLSRRKK